VVVDLPYFVKNAIVNIYLAKFSICMPRVFFWKICHFWLCTLVFVIEGLYMKTRLYSQSDILSGRAYWRRWL
jgi:hypothetical protein